VRQPIKSAVAEVRGNIGWQGRHIPRIATATCAPGETARLLPNCRITFGYVSR
jgi:hypothetical protein